MTHTLKTEQPYFDALWSGRKNFEIRNNDRDYQPGDRLILREYKEPGMFTGREVHAEVSYMTDYKQRKGFVVLALDNIEWY